MVVIVGFRKGFGGICVWIGGEVRIWRVLEVMRIKEFGLYFVDSGGLLKGFK